MKKLTKAAASLFFILLAFLFFQTTASAHVVVKPDQSQAGAWETYTIKIPTEKNVPTKKVVLKIPDGSGFEGYQPASGWDVTTQKDTNGKVKSVTWTAKGAGIKPGEFQQFQFTVENPKKTTQLAWDAYQYYQDGSIVEWTKKEGADTPHSITKIVKSATAADQTGAQKQQKSQPSGSRTLPVLSVILSAAAAILAIISLFIALRARK